MRHSFFSLFFLLLTASTLQAIDASIAYASFKDGHQPYVEVYLQIAASTVKYRALDSTHYQASVEVVLMFKKQEQIVKFDKYQLNTQPGLFAIDFIDMKRYTLDNGNYTLEVSLRDLNKPNNAKTYKIDFGLEFKEQELQQSDLQLLSTFRQDSSNSPLAKSGYYLECLPSAFYNKNLSRLSFYNEIYHSDLAIKDDFLVSYGIEKTNAAGKTETVMIGHKKRSPKPVDVLLFQLDISQLPSGNYQLFVEVRNRTRQLLSRKTNSFVRSNPFLQLRIDTSSIDGLDNEFVSRLPQDSLRYSLKAIAAKMRGDESQILNLVISGNDPRAQRNFLFRYWSNQTPNAPKLAYEAYMDVARKVDKQFKSGFGYGFETDRGYIYMKYGKPDDIVTVEEDPVAPPYEIWVYYSLPLTRQTNVKFLFYNPSLSTNDFRLLHSTCRGEINNPRWQTVLYSRAPNEWDGDNYNDATRMKDNFNRHASRYFDDF